MPMLPRSGLHPILCLVGRQHHPSLQFLSILFELFSRQIARDFQRHTGVIGYNLYYVSPHVHKVSTQNLMSSDNLLQSLVQRLPEVRFIDPDTVICGTHLCHPMLNGILLYRDSGHLNDVGARLIGQELIKRGTSLTGRQHANHRANAG